MGPRPHFALARRRREADDEGMKKLVVPVDFSDAQGRVITAAENEAKLRGASLVLVHVIEPAAEVAGFETSPEMMSLTVAQDLEAEQRVENARLKELAKQTEARGINCDFSVRFGLPADEILSAAAEHGADLMVMGSHGHGALYHLFTGSVVTGVLKRTTCPVLVVPLRDRTK